MRATRSNRHRWAVVVAVAMLLAGAPSFTGAVAATDPQPTLAPNPEPTSEPCAEATAEPGVGADGEPCPEATVEPPPDPCPDATAEPGPDATTEPGPDGTAEPGPDATTEPGIEVDAEPADPPDATACPGDVPPGGVDSEAGPGGPLPPTDAEARVPRESSGDWLPVGLILLLGALLSWAVATRRGGVPR